MFLIDLVIPAYLEVSSEQLCIYFAKLPEFSAPSSLSKGVDSRQWSVDVDHYLPNNGSKPVLMTARINGTKHLDFGTSVGAGGECRLLNFIECCPIILGRSNPRRSDIYKNPVRCCLPSIGSLW